MKKGIEVWSEHDQTGEWTLVIAKRKGRLSLDDIRDTAMEYEEDFYLLPIVAFSDRDKNYDGYNVPNNDGTTTHYDDLVRLYRMGDVWKEAE